ncbi:hypothetical protein DFH11DRAFT_1515691 [Phellopilus nigrolimitatus]|nr:hypothetical protein DFH11DRAFT_1515691 [Phellopilus nigrolimitatus]
MHSIRSDIEPIDSSAVPFIISAMDTLTYAGVAALTLLVYDMIITMDKEIKYFWVRYLYWMTILLIDCSSISLPTIHLPLISYTDILLMRVLALYHQDEKLTACLRTLFGLEAAFALGALIYTIIYQEISVWRLAEGVTVCSANKSFPKVWGALTWVAPMLYAITLMVLALWKAAQHWKESANFSQSNLLVVLIQDQAIYFTLVIFCCIMRILYISNPLLANLMSALGSPSLLSVLGSHLLVHLKEAGVRQVNGGTSYRMMTMNSMQFS